MAGNVLRGALGKGLREVASAEDYARIFEPKVEEPKGEPGAAGAGPSGFSDWPRPFVLRCAGLHGRILQPGERFCLGINFFDLHALDHFTRAFAQWADVVSVEHEQVIVELTPPSEPVHRIRVEFQTPTELKANGQCAKREFSILLARARDRVSTLRSLYGAGPLEIDFRALGERAKSVRTVRSELRSVTVERRSRRTGQRHGIGGVSGFVEYEGDLAEFMPYLEAASWTGVGRHCTWGNGQIVTAILTSDF
jgi:CRISPR-associated endoribonuclease Cas6